MARNLSWLGESNDREVYETGSTIGGFRDGLVHGPAVYFAESGATEERTYSDGVCQGPATLRMPNGDSEERMYEGGALHGIATFFSHMGDR